MYVQSCCFANLWPGLCLIGWSKFHSRHDQSGSTTQVWVFHVISMEFLRSFPLRTHWWDLIFWEIQNYPSCMYAKIPLWLTFIASRIHRLLTCNSLTTEWACVFKIFNNKRRKRWHSLFLLLRHTRRIYKQCFPTYLHRSYTLWFFPGQYTDNLIISLQKRKVKDETF